MAGWQRSWALAPAVAISADRVVKQTLLQAFHCRGEVMQTVPAVSREKLALSFDLLLGLLGWAQSRSAAEPVNSSEHIRDACELVLGFFGMLRRSELAALHVRDVRVLESGEMS